MAALGVERGIRNRLEFFQELGRAPPYYAWILENARDGELFLTKQWGREFSTGDRPTPVRDDEDASASTR